MISICCCALNAKWDVEIFVRALVAQNPDVDFEVVVTLDDRMFDGSLEHLRKLEKEIKQLKIVHHTNDDTIQYLEAVIDYYDKKDLFTPAFRGVLKENLEKYKAGTFLDRKTGFLWLTSGLLYNKAVQASSGELLIVTPGDFMYLFSLKKLIDYVKRNHRDGQFYISPNALFARVTNQNKEWLDGLVDRIYNGEVGRGAGREGYRWDSIDVFRDYLNYSPDISRYYVPNFKEKRLVSLTDHNFHFEMEKLCNTFITGKNDGMQAIQYFHGYHIMSKKTYKTIGGFTEEYYARAFPDDKMTNLGNKIMWQHTPPEISLAWCGQHEICLGRGPEEWPDWKARLAEVDPLWDQHPIPSINNAHYLHDGAADGGSMAQIVNRTFDRNSPPVRIMTNG